MGSDKDPTWRDFPQALSETRGVRRYVTLFEAPFVASALSDHENNALQAGSLLAMPPPAPGSQPLAGSTMVDLPGNSLTQWAIHVQDVASGMRLPPEVAVNCPQADIVGVLNQLEGMTRVQYCHLCFGVSQKCRCSSVPHQAPSQASALWTPPTMSYVAMTSSTKTTASSSVAGVPPPRYPPPGLPPFEPMDTLLAPPLENLLATAGVGRGSRGRSQPSTPTAPGLRQMRPTAPQQWMPTPRKAGDKPGNSLPAACVPALTPHWGTNNHPQAKHRS